MRLDNLIAVIIGLVMFFASWFVMGLAFNTTIPGIVFLLALLLLTASVSLPMYVLDRLDRR
jgi:hypothetical protein